MLPIRTSPRYEMLFGKGEFNCTLLIGPDPIGGNFDYQVFLEARRKLKLIDLKMTVNERGLEVYEKIFDFNGSSIKARIQLVLGRNYHGDVQELWREALANDGLIYLKTHAGYGRHISLSDDVRYFTEYLKKGSDQTHKKPYRLFYLDCCKSEIYYQDVLRDYAGDDTDLILNKWFCDFQIIGPVVVLIDELTKGSDFTTIVSEMNYKYGVPHIDPDDDPADLMLDRKMITYCISKG